MLNRNRLVVLAALAVATFLLVSCGGSETPEPAAPDTDQPEGAPAVGAGEGLPAALPGPGVDPEKVVARVNGAGILARDVHGLALALQYQILKSGQTMTEDIQRELLRTSLEQLIDSELMVQEARAAGTEATPEEIQAHVQFLRDNLGTQQAFEQYLQQMGLTEEDVRSEAERAVLAQKYSQGVAGGAKVTAAEARKFYDENPKMFQEPERVKIYQILLRARRDDPEEKRSNARARAEAARARIVGGETFEAVAKEVSQISNAAAGGEIDQPVGRGETVPEFEKMAFEIKVGGLSPVFETAYGFNVIKKTEHFPPKPIQFEEVKPQLMLQMTKLKEQAVVTEKAAELRADAEVEYLDEDMAPQAGDEGGGAGD